jgi:hypothetical protein
VERVKHLLISKKGDKNDSNSYKGDKNDSNSYKVISILSTMYNILSVILLSKLTPHAEEIIADHQCGFRAQQVYY